MQIGTGTLAPEAIGELSYIRIPRYVEEELGADYEVMRLGLAEQPRGLNDRPAPWLVDTVKKAYPTHFAWASLGDEFDWQKDGKTFRGGETEAEVALFILTNTHGANGRCEDQFLNESCLGWIDDEKKGTVLVTDLYEMSEAMLAAVQNFVFETGLRFTISGITWHHPSTTVRLQLWRER